MTTITPWINFNGNAEVAFTFYKSVFGGEFTKIVRLKNLAGPEFPVAEADAEKIMQIVLPIGNGNMLTGNDVPKIHVYVDSREEAEKIFNELSVEGHVEAPLDNSPWGTCFGMFRDKYGIEWIIECDLNK